MIFSVLLAFERGTDSGYVLERVQIIATRLAVISWDILKN